MIVDISISTFQLLHGIYYDLLKRGAVPSLNQLSNGELKGDNEEEVSWVSLRISHVFFSLSRRAVLLFSFCKEKCIKPPRYGG